MDTITLIIPCYNEEESLPYLKKELDKLTNKMSNVNFEIIMINNCSEDNTLKIIKEYSKKDKKYNYISFSRNFGKEASMLAGLEHSTGDYIAIMDADLQDPPYLLEKMYEEIKTGEYDSIATYRSDRKGEKFFRSLFAKMYYKIMSKLTNVEIKSGARDFRLMTRQMVDSILLLKEKERFTKGIFSWVGFKTKWIAFNNQERIAGKTKLPINFAFGYAVKGITSFSTIPLKLASITGIIFCSLSIIYTIYTIIKYFINPTNITPGYSSLICVTLMGFGIVLLVLGVISEYLSQMYNEIKNRPSYIIKETNKKDISK